MMESKLYHTCWWGRSATSPVQEAPILEPPEASFLPRYPWLHIGSASNSRSNNHPESLWRDSKQLLCGEQERRRRKIMQKRCISRSDFEEKAQPSFCQGSPKSLCLVSVAASAQYPLPPANSSLLSLGSKHASALTEA